MHVIRVYIFKKQFIAQFQLYHCFHPVLCILVFFMSMIAEFTYYVVCCLILIFPLPPKKYIFCFLIIFFILLLFYIIILVSLFRFPLRSHVHLYLFTTISLLSFLGFSTLFCFNTIWIMVTRILLLLFYYYCLYYY